MHERVDLEGALALQHRLHGGLIHVGLVREVYLLGLKSKRHQVGSLFSNPISASESESRADIAILGAGLMQHDDMLLDITVRHDFIGAGRDGGQRHGMLRNPDQPDQILAKVAAENIRHYRNPYRNNRVVAFLPACMSTSGRIHGEFLWLLFFIANKGVNSVFIAKATGTAIGVSGNLTQAAIVTPRPKARGPARKRSRGHGQACGGQAGV